MAFLEGTI